MPLSIAVSADLITSVKWGSSENLKYISFSFRVQKFQILAFIEFKFHIYLSGKDCQMLYSHTG